MKLHLPSALRKALLLSLSTLAFFSQTVQAGTLHSQATLQTYTDFGQNMGRYVTGSRVNALLAAIRKNEGITITYTDGRAPYRLVTDQMISFDGQTNEGAFTAIGYNFLASVQHNGTPNPTFTSQELPANNSVRYTGIEYRSSSIFINTPDTDYKITRLSKVITDAQTSAVYTGEVPRDTLLYRAGAGVMSVRNTDGSVNVIYDAYAYITGGIARTDGMGVVGESGDSRALSTHFNFSAAGISDLNPLPFSGDSGDSGSPVWIWNEETSQYEYLVAAQAVNGTYGRGTNTYCKGAPEWSVETMDSYSREVAMDEGTGIVHIGAVTTQGETLTDTAGRVGEQWSGVVTNAAGQTLTSFQGVHSGINTWMSLTPEINKDNWYAYGDAYLNAGDAVSETKALSKASLFCTQNLVFNSSAAQNNIEIADAGVDLGVGYARFSRANDAGDTVHYSISGGMFNHAGYVVDEGVEVHLKQANTDANYVREWRKVGEGDLYIEGTGNNEIVLNVGDKGSVYLDEKGENAYAAYNVLANTGATVVLQGGVNQIARDFTFGNGGGKLDLYGHSMTWDNSETDVSADGFTIHALTEEAVITNSSATAVTLTISDAGATYMGSFQDCAGAGALNIVYNGTEKWTLNSIATNLRNNAESSFTVQQGSVELAGTNTKHAMGSIDGRSTRRLENPNDWHYADSTMNVMVKEGAEFILGSHARLTGSVMMKGGSILTINEGVRHTYEYVEGAQVLEDVTSEFYRGFYGLHGNIIAETGTTIRFLYSEGTDAEQVYTGNIQGYADVEMNLGGSGAVLRLTGTNAFSGTKSLAGGGLVSDNGLAGLGRVTGQENAWHVAEDAFIAAKGADAAALLGMLRKDSTGTLALAQNQETLLDLQAKGYTHLIIGALAGEEVHYGTAGATLRAVNSDGQDRWLLGGGGGNLIVDASLQNASGELLLGNEHTTGKVTLTNTANSIGTITFAGQVTLEYTDEAALGGATVDLNYTNRLLLLTTGGLEQVRASSTGVILMDKLGGTPLDMSQRPGLYLGSAGSVELDSAPTLASGESYRFGGITGTLKLNMVLENQHGHATGLSVDAQTFSGGVLELAQAATITGAVDVRGYDTQLMPETMPRQGDITLKLDENDSLVTASSVTLGEGGIIDINGTAQTFHNLTMAQGSLLTDTSPDRGGSLTVNVSDGQTSNLAGNLNISSLTKTGQGEMVLSGANSCGTFTINEGTVSLASTDALGADGVTIITQNGTLNTVNAAVNHSIRIEGGTMVVGNKNVSGSISVEADGRGAVRQQGAGDITTAISSSIDVGSGGTLELNGSRYTLTNTAINMAEGAGTISVLAKQLNLNNTEVIDVGGTLSFDSADNQTLNSNRSGNNGIRNIAHLHIGGGVDKELHLDEVTWNTIWNIGKLTGEGKLVWDSDTTHWFSTRLILSGENTFNGSIIANRNNSGSQVRPYATHLELANDGAAKAAHVQLKGADDNDYMGLAINTDNASMLSLEGNRYTVMYAAPSVAGIGKQQGEPDSTPGGLDVKPVSTRNATLTITGDKTATFSGDVQGGEDGLGLSIVKSGLGTQTFDGSSVTFNDVSVLGGTLNLNSTELTVNGNLSLVRGTTLSMSEPYTLGSGKVLDVTGNADTSARLSTTLALDGGLIHLSGETLDADTATLALGSVSGSNVNVMFSNTSSIETDKRYWLADQNWTGVTVNTPGVEYLSVIFETTNAGLYATFSIAQNTSIWNGSDSQHNWTTSQFSSEQIAFTSSRDAAFTDKASNKNVVLDGRINAAELIFDSIGEYTFSGNGSVQATSLLHKGTGSTDLGGKVSIAGTATISAGTLTMNTGDSVQGVELDENATLRLTAANITTGAITGAGTVSLAAGKSVTADLPTIGEAGIGSLTLESGRYYPTSTLNVKDSLWLMEDASLTTGNGRVLQDGGIVHLAGNLVLDTKNGNTTLSNAVAGIGDATGIITKQSSGTLTVAADITASSFWIMSGSVAVKEDASLNVGSVALRLGSDVQIRRRADTQQHLGTMQMDLSTTFTLNSVEQPSTALIVDELKLLKASATVKQQNNAGALVIRALSSASSTELNLVNEANSTKVAFFELGGADKAADFNGKITLTSTNGGNQRSAVVVLDDANVAANAVVDLASAASSSALLGLGINAQQVQVAGLASGAELGRRASVFSGTPGINADTPSSFDGDGVTRELLITTASGAEHAFNGRVGMNLDLVVDGQGTQRFLGDMSDFNAKLTLRGGTLELGQNSIGAASSVGFDAELAGGTLRLSGGFINLGEGTLSLTAPTTIDMTEEGEYLYQDGNDLENGFHTMAVIKSGNLVGNSDSIIKQGVLSNKELMILSTGVYALDPAEQMTYFVNTEAGYAASGPGAAYEGATSLVLNTASAVLNLQSNLSETATGGIETRAAGGRVNLGEDVVLDNAALHDSQDVTLGGGGTYRVAVLANGTNTTLGQQGHVSLSDDWNGTVELQGDGGSQSQLLLETYGNSQSTIKLTGNAGSLTDNATINAKLLLADSATQSALTIVNNGGSATFNGAIGGSGSIKVNSSGDFTYKFHGNLNEWTGAFINADGNTSLYFLKGVSDVSAGIAKESGHGGSVAIHVGENGAEGANVTFRKSVVADALAIEADSSATFTNSATIAGAVTASGTLVVANGGTLTLQGNGGSSTVSGNIEVRSGGALAINGTLAGGAAVLLDGGTLDLTDLTGAVQFRSLNTSGNSCIALGTEQWLSTTGALSLTGNTTLDLTSLTITDDKSTYVLATGQSVTLGNGVDFTLAERYDKELAHLSVMDGNSLVLIMSADMQSLVWKGGDGLWTTDSTQTPWHLFGTQTDAAFQNGDKVTFAASTGDNTATLGDSVSPFSLTMESGADATIDLNGKTLSNGDMELGSGSSLTVSGNDGTLNNSGSLNMNAGSRLVIDNAGADVDLGDVSLGSEASLDVLAAGSVKAQSVCVADAVDATIQLEKDMTVAAEGGQAATSGALYTAAAEHTLSILSVGEARALTVDKFDIANNQTAVSLQNATLNVQGAATVGTLVTGCTTDSGTVTVGDGATLNLNGGVNWNKADGANTDVVDVTIQQGGTLNVNAGNANTLNDVTVEDGGSLHFADGTLTTIRGTLTLAEAIDNAGIIDFAGREMSIALDPAFEAQAAGYTDIHGVEGDNGFHHTAGGTVISNADSGNFINADDVQVSFGGEDYELRADGTFGNDYNRSEYHVRSGSVSYAELAESPTITTIAVSGNGTLNLDTELAPGMAISATGGTVNIDGGVTLQAPSLTASAPTTLGGSGTYELNNANGMPENVQLAEGAWTGTVCFTGTSNAFDPTGSWVGEGSSASTVKLDNWSGSLANGSAEIGAKVLLSGYLQLSEENEASLAFTNTVSGDEGVILAHSGPGKLNLSFIGGEVAWSGMFGNASGTAELTYQNVACANNQIYALDGMVVLHLDNVAAFNGALVNVSKLYVSGNSALNSDSSLLALDIAQDAVFTIGGNITVAGAASIGSGARVNVESDATLRLTHANTAAAVIKAATGSGEIVLGANATLANGVTTAATGKLTVGSNATLTIGSGDGQNNNLSSFSCVELDGGKIHWNSAGAASGSVSLNGLATTSKGGTFLIYDINGNPIVLGGTTTLNGNLTLVNNNWGNGLTIQKLTGAGSLNATSGSSADALTIDINSIENYTGGISIANSKTILNASMGENVNLASLTLNAGTANIKGGFTAGALNGTGNGNLHLDSVTLDVAADSSYSGTLSIAGKLVKDGLAKQTLTVGTEENPFLMNEAYDLNAGTLALAGHIELKQDAFIPAGSIFLDTNGAEHELGKGSGYQIAKGDVTVVNVKSGATLDVSGATFTYNGQNVTVNEHGVFTVQEQDIAYETYYVFTGTTVLSEVQAKSASMGETLKDLYLQESGSLNAAGASKLATLHVRDTAPEGDVANLSGNASVGNLTGRGILSVNGTLDADTLAADGAATLTLAGAGSATIGSLVNGGTGSLVFSGASATIGGNSTYAGNITIAGTVKVTGEGSLGSMDASLHTITIARGGILDVYGHEGTKQGSLDGYTVVFAGGTLTNTGTGMGSGKRQYVTHATLTADSTINAQNEFGITGSDYAATSLDLGEYTLEKTGTNTFWLSNSTVTGSGSIKVSQGTLAFQRGGTYAANLELAGGNVSGPLNLGGDVSVSASANASMGEVNLNGHDLNVEVSDNKSLTVTGALSGNGNLTASGEGTKTFSGSTAGFSGSIDVQAGIMDIMNAASVNVQDVTIGDNGTLGVYSNGTVAEANEGTVTIRDTKTLTAGKDAKLNANLVMESGSTLDVRGTGGSGLLMGSEVTLSKGMTLSDYSGDWASWEVGTTYTLFTGVDGLDIGNGVTTGTMDYTQLVDAKEYFDNIQESNRYFLCYGGAPSQDAVGVFTSANDGSNVGMVYIMAMPEPTTSTLSLLALAALAARRRRK